MRTGIFTTPIQVALRYDVPLMMWGEHGFADIGGMYGTNDFVEFTAKFRLEHGLRGLLVRLYGRRAGEARSFGVGGGTDSKDLLWAQYPDDDSIDEAGTRGIYLFNFVKWDANDMRNSSWTNMIGSPPSNHLSGRMNIFGLDDMHENGIHDYLKFVKFGYGRATDHTTKDIRSGLMTRAEGVELVRKYDHVKPRRDLERWLEYVDMTESDFDYVCDTFRDRRVWDIEDGQWVKDDLWGGRSAYGPVHPDLDAS